MNSILKSPEVRFFEFDSRHKKKKIYEKYYVRRSHRIINKKNPLRVYKKMGSYQKVNKIYPYKLYVFCEKTSCNMRCILMNKLLKRIFAFKKKQDPDDFFYLFTNVCDRKDNESLIKEMLYEISKVIQKDDSFFIF